jgi:hypothetical protein
MRSAKPLTRERGLMTDKLNWAARVEPETAERPRHRVAFWSWIATGPFLGAGLAWAGLLATTLAFLPAILTRMMSDSGTPERIPRSWGAVEALVCLLVFLLPVIVARRFMRMPSAAWVSMAVGVAYVTHSVIRSAGWSLNKAPLSGLALAAGFLSACAIETAISSWPRRSKLAEPRRPADGGMLAQDGDGAVRR